MSFVEKYPHPGYAPPDPGPKPANWGALNDEDARAWWTARTVFETYTIRLRRHRVAVAVDQLSVFRPSDLTAAESIALAVGLTYLDGIGVPREELR